MLEWISSPEILVSILTLTALEIILGIDNIVFISVIIDRIPPQHAKKARKIGLSLAVLFRIIMLTLITKIIGFTAVLFRVFGQPMSWRDLILIGGGLFLIYKAVLEIHSSMEKDSSQPTRKNISSLFVIIIIQIVMIDMVFSIDSIVTAIGMTRELGVMVAAVVIAMIVMYFASEAISEFIKLHPSTKILALAFLFVVAVALIAEGFGFHIPRVFIYFTMAFAAIVEILNTLIQRKKLNKKYILNKSEENGFKSCN